MPIRAYFDTFDANSELEMLAIHAHKGDICRRIDVNKTYVLRSIDPANLESWVEILTTANSNFGNFN
jgi:hypothetical protein